MPRAAQASAIETTSQLAQKQAIVAAPLRSAAAAERSASAAERSASNTARSAVAAERSAEAATASARTAAAALWTARWAAVLNILALLSPYIVIWLNRRHEDKKERNKQGRLDARARAAVNDTLAAVDDAVARHKGQNWGVGELWSDLSKLSSLRNVLKIYLDEATSSHELLLALSEAFQINFATRDGLIMRNPSATGGKANDLPDCPRSDSVLTTSSARVAALRSTLETAPKGGQA